MAKEATAGPQRLFEARIVERHRSGHGDRVVFSERRRVERVARFEFEACIRHRPQVNGRLRDEIGMNIDRFGGRREQTHAGAEVARAGADLEHSISRTDRQRLQDPALQARCEHHLTSSDRNRYIGEGDGTVCGRHERFARHTAENIEHAPIEHFPSADLLFNHLPTSG